MNEERAELILKYIADNDIFLGWKSIPTADEPDFLEFMSLLESKGFINAEFRNSSSRENRGEIVNMILTGITPIGKSHIAAL